MNDRKKESLNRELDEKIIMLKNIYEEETRKDFPVNKTNEIKNNYIQNARKLKRIEDSVNPSKIVDFLSELYPNLSNEELIVLMPLSIEKISMLISMREYIKYIIFVYDKYNKKK